MTLCECAADHAAIYEYEAGIEQRSAETMAEIDSRAVELCDECPRRQA